MKRKRKPPSLFTLFLRSLPPALIFVISFPLAAQENPEARKLYQEGNRKFNDGLFEDAVRKYDQALGIERHYAIYYQRGLALRKAERHAASLESFREAVSLHRDFALGWYGMATAFAVLGRHDSAVSAYEKALALDPRLEPARKGLTAARTMQALALIDSGDARSAAETARKACGADSTFPQAHLVLARALGRLGDVEGSVREAEYVIRNHPAFARDAWYELGLTYEAAGDLEGAARAFTEALNSPRVGENANRRLRRIDSLRNTPKRESE
ncbi:MAG: tetratricopeptide repeat protein [Bacteroidota bacterium]|nr:tetratricopeptide repeat protein [Bacteroidota bacterium]